MPTITTKLYSNVVNYGVIGTTPILVRKLMGRSAFRRRDHAIGNEFDERYGVKTNVIVKKADGDLQEEHVRNAESHVPVEPEILLKALRGARIDNSRYVFVDIGSGLGRALIFAATEGFRRVIGVELSPQLHKLAGQNLATYKAEQNPRVKYELYNINALDFDFPNAPLCIYIYRPFKPVVFTAFLKRLQRSIVKYDRPVVVVSVYPFDLKLYEEHAPSLRLERDIQVGEMLHCWQVFKTRRA